MKKVLFVLLFAFLLASCKYGFYLGLFDEDDVDERTSSLKKLSDLSFDADVFSFVIVSDVHFGSSASRDNAAFFEWYKNALESAEIEKKPRFLVCLGDSADKGYKSEFEEYNEFLREIESMESSYWGKSIKSLTILGNHDLYNNGWENWKSQVYPYTAYYSLVLNGKSGGSVSLFFLDSANGTLGVDQLESLESEISADVNPKIVFSHYPVYAGGNLLMTLQDTTERSLLLTWFSKNNVRYVFAGHAHKNYGFSHSSFREDVTASYVFNRYFRLVTVNTVTGNVSSELLSY